MRLLGTVCLQLKQGGEHRLTSSPVKKQEEQTGSVNPYLIGSSCRLPAYILWVRKP